MKKLLPFLVILALLPACGKKGPNVIEQEEKVSKADFPNPPVETKPLVDYTKWEIKNGKFYLDGKWKFLKIAKPLTITSNPPECQEIINEIPDLKKYFYNTVTVLCDYSHFDTNGDGVLDKSLEPLANLIDKLYEAGFYPAINFGTYTVGGGALPDGFWERFPDAFAVNDEGRLVTDTEYGFGSKVVSIFHEGYREAMHEFIKTVAKAVDTKKVLYIETTVEPQYMGAIKLCYSENARKEYNKWRKENGITDKASEMPTTFPIPSSFVTNPTWNKFRAQFLAKWVNDDIKAWRSVAGPKAYAAVDYLDTSGSEMYLRCGDQLEFLRSLTEANIIQVNWHWSLSRNAPNQEAYDKVHKVMAETGRDWAVSEHMTLNGSDFTNFNIDKVMMNTLQNGTRFGWEFTNYRYSTQDSFTLYTNDGKSKRVIRDIDKYWGYWLHTIEEIENSHKYDW